MKNIYPKLIVIVMIFLVSLLINFNNKLSIPKTEDKIIIKKVYIIKKDTIRCNPIIVPPTYKKLNKIRFSHKKNPVC